MQFLTILLGASALITPTLAQTWSACNPANKTETRKCPNDPGFGIAHNFDFKEAGEVKNSFNITNGKLAYGADGTEFTINKQGESPTIQSKFYIHFGTVSVIMKAASGVGIVSSIVIQSECLDEIDWEFIGGNGTHAQTNYFGDGDTSSYNRDVWHPVADDVRENFHNYTVDWKSDKMEFFIDSVLVRTLMYGDANGGKNYPQTPSTVRLGIWAGGDKDNNGKWTVIWAGGETDFSKAPFQMVVKSTYIKDYGNGKEYEWTDKSSDFTSIKSIPGTSVAAQNIADPEAAAKAEKAQDSATKDTKGDSIQGAGKTSEGKSEASTGDTSSSSSGSTTDSTKTDAAKSEETEGPSVAEKFQALPPTTKVAIYAGAGTGAALLAAAFLFVCIRQRRKGREERDAYNAQVEKDREAAYQDQVELREKGLGGWDKNASSQGEDALGGWNSNHSTDRFGGNATSAQAVPLRAGSESPESPRAVPAWAGGNQGGMIHNAQNAYNGGYNSNSSSSYNDNGTTAYGGQQNIPRSPNFPLASQNSFTAQGGFPPASNAGFGTSHGGYQRF